MNFPNRKRIVPRSIASGYIFTNWTKGTKVIDVDLIGRDFSQNFTFFAHNPDNTEGVQVVQSIEKIYPISDIQDVKSEFELRRILEGLPCCVSREDGTPSGEPINLVLIGKLEDWATGIVRRGYRYHKMTPRYAFGRKSDISGYKISREYKNPQTHAVRLWKTPTRYKGKPVWVGQTSNRFGGRFAEKMPIEETLPIDPSVDEVRIDLTQDLAYSQTLIKIGHVKGGGRSKLNQSNASEKGLQYDTDGLRVVLVFGERPVSLSEIDFFNWEKLSDYR
jgi:hypothetical protein